MFKLPIKRLCFIICFAFVTQASKAQLFGPLQMINDEAGIIYGIHSFDMDNDGFKDIISVAYNTISWYKNLNGQGTFNPPIIIQEGLGQVFNSTIADLDKDGYIDLIISSFDEDKVVWFKSNGDGTFATMQTIATGLNRASGVVANDLDQDGDLDLVLGVSNGSGLYWVENLDGQGNFSTLNLIDANIPAARFQAVADIDGDGDMDILTNSVGDYFLSWYENTDGQGNFAVQHIIDAEDIYENTFYFEDLNGDGKLDILTYRVTSLLWRENLDGLGNYGEIQIINEADVGGFSDSKPTDIDNDNDFDILIGSIGDFKVGWHENIDGFGNFSEVKTIDSTLVSGSNIVATDIDNDGDLDLVVNSLIANGEKFLVWFENLTILGANDYDIESNITITPNPIKDTINIIPQNNIEINKIQLYNILGKLLLETQNTQQVNVSYLASGVLFVKIHTNKGILVKKVIKN